MILKNLPKFETQKELFDYVVKNEQTLFAQAKMEMKEADGFGFSPIMLKSNVAEKGASVDDLLAKDSLQAKLAINTTNVIDSHKDLHIPGLWDKSIKENKRILHLQEHNRSFKGVIAKGENVKTYTETKTWRQLGFDLNGKTEVLTFDSNILKSQNTEMFIEYAKGQVEEHSVGMQYVKIATCINDEDYPIQKENWDKYIEMAVNPESVEKGKLFWAVTEAKAIEGSAVLLGSNSMTPTQAIKNEPELTKEQKETQATLKWLGVDRLIEPGNHSTEK